MPGGSTQWRDQHSAQCHHGSPRTIRSLKRSRSICNKERGLKHKSISRYLPVIVGFRRRFSLSTSTYFNSTAWHLRSLTWLAVAERTASPATRRLPTSRNSFDQLQYRRSAMSSRRQSSEMVTARRKQSRVKRIFSSVEYYLRLTPRMSRTRFSYANELPLAHDTKPL